MSASAASDDPTFRFLREAYHHLVCTLRLILPPLPSENPDDIARRDRAAVSTIAGLCPANSGEARLAADFVACSEYASDCLRLAQRPGISPETAAKCRAEARSNMREAKSAIRTLLKVQQERRKREADAASRTGADWMEYCALDLMTEALDPAAAQAPPAPCPDTEVGQPPAPPPVPEPPPEPVAAAGPAAAPSAAPSPAPQPNFAPFEDAEPDLATEAEQYAILYPQRAALIRRSGGVPADVTFGPPDDDLVQALLTTHTPTLIALDREYASAHAA